MVHAYFVDEPAVSINLFGFNTFWLIAGVLIQVYFVVANNIWHIADKNVIGLDIQMDYTNLMKLLDDFYQFETELQGICDWQIFINAIQNILEWNTMLFQGHEVVIFGLFHA